MRKSVIAVPLCRFLRGDADLYAHTTQNGARRTAVRTRSEKRLETLTNILESYSYTCVRPTLLRIIAEAIFVGTAVLHRKIQGAVSDASPDLNSAASFRFGDSIFN
jgi:hypothetical protein